MKDFLLNFLLFILNLFFKELPFKTTTPSPSLEPFCPFVQNSIETNNTCSYGYTGSFCDECGLRFSKPNVRIVGGSYAVPNSWPSMALVVFRYTWDLEVNGSKIMITNTGYCGGSLIDRETILTAAHCFYKNLNLSTEETKLELPVLLNQYHQTFESMYTVYLGLNNNSAALNDLENADTIPLEIKSFKIHEKYDEKNALNDIGIIKLKKKVSLNCKIQTACLPNPSIPNYPSKLNGNVWVAGWGFLGEKEEGPQLLKNVQLSLYDSSYCSKVKTDQIKEWNNQLCAGEIAGGKSPCFGDSGGPLFYLDEVNGKQKYVLIGLVSYGEVCAAPDYPGIFVKVSSYLDWIKQNI